jgi:hypothetical protein
LTLKAATIFGGSPWSGTGRTLRAVDAVRAKALFGRAAALLPIYYPGGNRRNGYRWRRFFCSRREVTVMSLGCKEDVPASRRRPTRNAAPLPLSNYEQGCVPLPSLLHGYA